MDVKTLRIILPLVPMILLAATVAAAFATHGWDVEATLFVDNPARKMENLIAPDVMAGDDAFKVSDVVISDDGRKISLEIEFRSPLNVPVTVKELSADIATERGSGRLSLQDEVKIPPKESATLEIAGPLDGAPSTMGTTQSPSNITMKLEIGGIIIEMAGMP